MPRDDISATRVTELMFQLSGHSCHTVTVDKMKAGISISRNPIILKFMQNYQYADQPGRGIPMVLRKIQKMPGFKFHLVEYEESFSASLEFP